MHRTRNWPSADINKRSEVGSWNAAASVNLWVEVAGGWSKRLTEV